jgi:hypothetical protein
MTPWKPIAGSSEYSDPKSWRKDPRRRWLFVTVLPVSYCGKFYRATGVNVSGA